MKECIRLNRPEKLIGILSSPDMLIMKAACNIMLLYQAMEKRLGLYSAAFTLIDFANTSSSLHDWICAEYARALTVGLKHPPWGPASSDASKHLRTSIRWWGPFRAIANASKHSSADDAYWPGGMNRTLFRGGHPATEAINNGDFTQQAAVIDAYVKGNVWLEPTLIHADGARTQACHAAAENLDDWKREWASLKAWLGNKPLERGGS